MNLRDIFHLHSTFPFALPFKIFDHCFSVTQMLFICGALRRQVFSCLWLGAKVSISSTFYSRLLCQYFWAKKLQIQNVTAEKLRNLLLYEKCMCKMLMKLTPGCSVNYLPLLG